MTYVVPTLDEVRQTLTRYVEGLKDRDGPYGAYRYQPGHRTDLYSSLDIAIMRTIMGEDLTSTLSASERSQWCDHINSFASRRGGTKAGAYEDTLGHDPLHANGMVIGALGVLGGKQLRPVAMYGAFDESDKIGPWLTALDWENAWSQSHAIWGGALCFSFSKRCSREWMQATLSWLDGEIDPETGWWRRGTACSDRHQPLGGLVHILPLYQHHEHPYPYPERVIDSILALQTGSGRWLAASTPEQGLFSVMHYLELDALYALRIMRDLVPGYRRGDIDAALDRYIALVGTTWPEMREKVIGTHPHVALAMAGTFGCLQQLRPDDFPDKSAWTDIFGDRRFYRTDAVEVMR